MKIVKLMVAQQLKGKGINMKQLVLIRVTKNTNVYDGLLREGDFILGPASTISVLVNHSSSWNSNQMDCKVATVEELKNCRAGHIRFHLFESANLAGFKRSLISKNSALEFIKTYGIDSYSQKHYEKP